ncbi:MAG TPA: hypothetical protein VJM31_17695 [Vicinamibacterales bacterium]|nr:hypothetical protein [Vicinamibacterales bacterium]
MTTEQYCREIESYLCRKNDGHLIRIVGPSFERVCSWASQGIPFKIACQGIDEYFVRYYAKGPRRRPVQIDFCEHDVLDAFDAWRRAVGVRVSDAGSSEEAPAKQRRRSLPDHLDRVCERVTARRAGMTPLPAEFDAVLETVSSEAASFRDLPGTLRGDARRRVTERLVELDRLMLDAARAQIDPIALQAIRVDAIEQLLPFRDRMRADAHQLAIEAAVDRLVRQHEQLPTVSFE